MLGTFWQPCPPGGGGGREREKERRLLLLGLTWNAITFDTPPAFEKTSHPAWFGRPIEQKWNPNRPTIYFGKELYIIAQNNAGKMATRKGHHPYSLKKMTPFEDGFRIMSLLEVLLNFFVCFSSTFDNFGYFADLFQTSKRSAVVSAKDNLSSSSIVQSYTVSNSTEVFS